MGQKVNPYGYRLGISKDWMSRWYADKKQYGNLILEDLKIRKYLEKKFEMAGVKSIEIERSVNEINIIVKVAKPGVVIGKGGSGVEDAEKELKKITKAKIRLTAEEVKNPEVEAQLVADYISRQLKRRLPYRRVVMAAISSARDKGAKGIKIKLAGLLSGGNSISRSEKYLDGSVPSQTLRADVDYAQVHCQMLYGTIGIKVWIYKGEAVL
ncbi:30S ribosomal protein S3 [candidate division WWE3 bacterium RIFCSPLOWO2_01_FULL_37_15]|uniref:Small ribosomal subunit protein uS3 n=1 Tax=candidate division WWE3 bacterium RIFCSPLOWO2_01_FULL_37_15 TaxID=1802622 RepID=A0A1F4V0E2_UNCKA|nr:MAG: 30S ribosomal protein S3 [candidate division WWE3 bacterium RIFCSPLOWO2_01_FULL_37_15]